GPSVGGGASGSGSKRKFFSRSSGVKPKSSGPSGSASDSGAEFASVSDTSTVSSPPAMAVWVRAPSLRPRTPLLRPPSPPSAELASDASRPPGPATRLATSVNGGSLGELPPLDGPLSPVLPVANEVLEPTVNTSGSGELLASSGRLPEVGGAVEAS